MTTVNTLNARARIAVAAATTALVLAACGSDPAPLSVPAEAATEAAPETVEAAPDTVAPPAAPAPDAAVKISQTELGDVLSDPNGMTLYLFTQDEGGAPTCTGGCAQAWPPLLVDGDIVAPEGVDPALLSTVEHPDGGMQLKIGKWPLYFFASDTAPGDVTGQGSGDVWFVVGADGTSIT